jgi:hypothetical protein
VSDYYYDSKSQRLKVDDGLCRTLPLYPGTLDCVAVERWHSISVEALFCMNTNIEHQLSCQLTSELEQTVQRGLLLSRSNDITAELIGKSVIKRQQHSIYDIARLARDLSFMIQHDILSKRLFVTIGPNPSSWQSVSTNSVLRGGLGSHTNTWDVITQFTSVWGNMGLQDLVLGSYTFGLQKRSASEEKVLISLKMTTTVPFQPAIQSQGLN